MNMWTIVTWVYQKYQLGQYLSHRFVSDLQQMDRLTLSEEQPSFLLHGERVIITGEWSKEANDKYTYRVFVFFRDTITPDDFHGCNIMFQNPEGRNIGTIDLRPRLSGRELSGKILLSDAEATLTVSQVKVKGKLDLMLL